MLSNNEVLSSCLDYYQLAKISQTNTTLIKMGFNDNGTQCG